MKEAEPRAIRLADYQPPGHIITDTELCFELADRSTRVTARTRIERRSGPATLRLDGQQLALESVAIDGRELNGNEYRCDDESLTLFDVPETFELSVVTRIDPVHNSALEGLYKSGGMFCTQCEAEGFRRITYYLDRPDVLARFTTTIIAPAGYPVLLSNGNLVDDQSLAGGRRKVTWHDPFPKPSYLFALVAGDLAVLQDQFVTASGRRVALAIYSEPHNIDQCGYAMGALKRAMRWDEEVYGREYDLDVFMIVAVDDFNMGAMENKGLNIFNTSCVLASPDTATDAAYRRVEGVVAHEYFHNWSGNRVTCRDWFQLSLKEGFTVFRDAQFSADMNSHTVKRIEDVDRLRTLQFPEDAGPLAHPVRPDSYIEISNFYTTTVYEKGAEVVGMLHTLLGPQRFRRGTDRYFAEHDGQAVTTEDFVVAMEQANGVDLRQFRRWYSQAGTPVLTITERYADGMLDLVIEQRCPATPGQPDKAPFHIPVALGLLDAEGHELLGEAGRASGSRAHVESAAVIENPRADGTLIVHAREPRTELRVRDLDARPVLSLLRGFSAPVNVERAHDVADLVRLALHDSDGFVRWDAMQSLLAAAVERIRAGAAGLDGQLLELFQILIHLARHAPDDGETKALLAAMLSLPGEAYLGERLPEIDVDGVHTARDALGCAIGTALFDHWLALYRNNLSDAPYRPDAPAMARRSLASVALSFACAAGAAHADVLSEVLWAQYRDADNLTLRLAALKELVDADWFDADARDRALDDFYSRWRHVKLCIDQWFAVQAARPADGALDRVRELETHPDFDSRNPNRVRSLYGVFAQQNLAQFHARDGAGYHFLAERVVRIDHGNPQLAARLVAPLTRWRRYDRARGQQMRAALAGIAASEPVSKDVFELVTKSLQADG
jgi:aminopeptidase N